MTNRASRTIGTAIAPARTIRDENVSTSTSMPISTNSTALMISSTSSQNVSMFSRVRSLMARRRPWLPISSPAATIASGPDVPIAPARA